MGFTCISFYYNYINGLLNSVMYVMQIENVKKESHVPSLHIKMQFILYQNILLRMKWYMYTNFISCCIQFSIRDNPFRILLMLETVVLFFNYLLRCIRHARTFDCLA